MAHGNPEPLRCRVLCSGCGNLLVVEADSAGRPKKWHCEQCQVVRALVESAFAPPAPEPVPKMEYYRQRPAMGESRRIVLCCVASAAIAGFVAAGIAWASMLVRWLLSR